MVKFRISLALLLCLFSTALFAVEEDTDVSAFLDTVQLRSYAPMRSMTRIKVEPCDSFYVERYKEMRYYNTDTLFHYLATRGFNAVEDELYYYYYDIVSYMDEEQAAVEIAKLRELARRYHHPEVTYASQFLPLLVRLATADSTRFEAVMDDIYHFARKVAAQGNVREEVNLLRLIFNESYLNGYYARGFRFARMTADRLDELTDDQYPERKATYYMVGKAYHLFRDYNRSIPYLKKSLRDDGSRHMADRANLRARHNLAEYYASVGDLEQSDRYYLSMWNSPDQVKLRPMYDAIALVGLASNEMKRSHYDTPLRVFERCLPFLIENRVMSLPPQVVLKMAECYLAKNDLPAACTMLDSARVWIDSSDAGEYRQYYSLLNSYYTRLGDAGKARSYHDSTMLAFRQYEDKYNTLVILRAEQELFASEQERKEMQLATFRRVSTGSCIVAGIILIVLLIISVLYRRKHREYRQLAALTREWAEQTPAVAPSAEADVADIALVEALNKLFDDEHIYLDCELDLEALANRLGVHRNALSKAINTVYDKPFSTYLNECRIRQAILLLSDPANDLLSLEKIAFDTGFSNRQTFYRAFKKQTGINPTTFRLNRE